MKAMFNVILISIIVVLLSQLEGIIQKSMAAEIPPANQASINLIKLSTEEKQWLKTHTIITVAVRHGWAPIAFIPESNKPIGISIDYLKKLEAMLGVKFVFMPEKENYAIENADIIAALPNPGALANSRFSALPKPYLVSPYAIYTKKESSDINGLSDLNGKRITVYKTGELASIFHREYPQITLFKADIAEESLTALRAGTVDAYVGNEMVVDYNSGKYGFNDIKSVSETDYSAKIYMGVRSDWPLLINILDKSFNAISTTENQKILSSWRPNLVSPYLNNKSILNASASLLLLLMLLGLWNKSLRNQLQAKTIIQKKLKQALLEITLNQKALEESRNKVKELSLVAERTTNPVVITDRHGFIKWVNHAFTNLSGYQPEFAIGKKPGSFLHGADTSQETVSSIRKAIRKHEDFNVEILNYNIHGQQYWTNVISTVIDANDDESGYFSIQIDITNNKKTLAEIKSINQEMHALFDMSPNPIAALDSELKISHVNSAFCTLFNMEEANIVGINEVDLDHLLQSMSVNNYLATSSFPYNRNFSDVDFIQSTDNHLLTFEIKPSQRTIARSYLDCKQPSISRIIYYRDITLESTLDKMKSEFVATAAHELRTPMTIIFGYAELLRITPPSIEMQKNMIDVIHAQSKCIIELLNDILDIARIEARTANVYNMKHQAIAPLLTLLAERFITLENHNLIDFEISQTLPDLYIDASKIEQAIKNCLSNAYKFSPDNGRVKMRVCEVIFNDKPHVLISIQDLGIGMTAAQLARIFEKFYRADPSGIIPGTGLGMAIIKEIIDHHAGNIEIKSQFGVGTNVLINLPITSQLVECV